MEKITIEVETQKTIVEKKEVQLPFYSKSNCHFYKVFSETDAVEVCALSISERIELCGSGIAFKHPECTKEEFELNFKRIAAKITKQALENDN